MEQPGEQISQIAYLLRDIDLKLLLTAVSIMLSSVFALAALLVQTRNQKRRIAFEEMVFYRERLEDLYECISSHHRETISDISKMVKPQSIDSVIEKMEKPISSIDKAEVLVNLYQPQIKKELDDLFEATDSLLSHLRKIRKNAPMTLLSFLDTEQYKTYIKKLHICKIKIKDVSRSLSI